jgi:hypothetical protein
MRHIILLSMLAAGCGTEFVCPVKVEIISDSPEHRRAYLEAIDYINQETGEFVFTLGEGDIRVFDWDQPGGQARGAHDLAFMGPPWRSIATHELLHLLGIGHDEPGTFHGTSVMHPVIGQDNTIKPHHIEHIYDYCGY